MRCHRVQLLLNRGEARHLLAKKIRFADEGVFRSGAEGITMNVGLDELIPSSDLGRRVTEPMPQVSPLAPVETLRGWDLSRVPTHPMPARISGDAYPGHAAATAPA